MPKATKRERQRINRELRREAVRKAEQRRRRLRTARNIALLMLPVIIVFGVIELFSSGGAESKPIKRDYAQAPPMTIDTSKTYTAVMKTTMGTMTFSLDAKSYPTSVNNFVFLAQNRFYDGLDFNRVAKDFVIQAGSPTNTTSGGPGYTVQGEVPAVPADGGPAYPIGSLAMAKSGSEPPGTAGSQFFIVTGTQNVNLTPDYAMVGTNVTGFDVAGRISRLYPPSGDGPPTKKVTITSLTIKVATPPTTTTSAP